MKRINIYTLKMVKEKGGLYDLETKYVRSPYDAYRAIEEVLELSSEPIENFGILTLNTKNEIAGVHVLHKGDINSSIVSPRLVFQNALMNNANGIICFHNHPSGNTTPSTEDITVTENLKAAGKLLGINVMDHIIVGDSFISLKERGYL